jgi:hypothetical protein
MEAGDFAVFNRRLLKHISSFGPELHSPVVFGSVVEEKPRQDVFLDRLAGAPRSIYGVREIRTDPIQEASPGQHMAIVTRALLPGVARLGRAGAIQAVIGDRLNETIRALVDGAQEAVVATDQTIARIDKAGTIAQATPMANCEVIARGEVIAVMVGDGLFFETAVGDEGERARFADFVRAKKALRSVAPRQLTRTKRAVTA